MNFWEKLKKPFFMLAPMEDVTDAAFRALIAKYGKPDVMMTEFTSADGLVRADEKGQRLLRKKLLFGEGERPIVAQLFSAHPDHMEKAATLCKELGFDGIDINMGCPVDEVVRQKCGAAMIREPENARAVIRAAMKTGLPVSVKTRIGFNSDELDTWLPELLKEKVACVTLHLRTRKEMSDVPAHWEVMSRAVELRDSLKSMTLIAGNGDVKDIAEARAKAQATGCDGVMLGRAIYGNPWLFKNIDTIRAEKQGDISPHAPTREEKVAALIEHLQLFDKLQSGNTNYAVMKKHFKAYISGWESAKELRIQLMDTQSVGEALALLTSIK